MHIIDTTKVFLESMYPGFWVIGMRAKTNYIFGAAAGEGRGRLKAKLLFIIRLTNV